MTEKFDPELNKETGQNLEVQAEFVKLDKKAGEIGDALENTDFTRIEPTEILRLNGKIEMVCNAMLVLTGAAVQYYSGEAMFDKVHPLNDTLRAVAAGLGIIGSVSAIYGFQKMIDGYRKLHGYVKKDEAEFYKNPG